MSKLVGFVFAVVAISFVCCEFEFITEEITGYHFHTYIFDVNPDRVDEALAFRRKTRELMEDGTLAACTLGRITLGWAGPHPFSQYEFCCNKTDYAKAASFYIQNHHNLSVLTHPLTIYDRADHEIRAGWLGNPVPLDTEDMTDVRPEPRRCGVDQGYPDEMPGSQEEVDRFEYIPGTEEFDYWMAKKSAVRY